MVHQKIFTTASGNQVKIIVRGYYSHTKTEIEHFVEISIKEHLQALFYSPTRLNLPHYGKYGKDDKTKVREQVVKVNGISDQQFDAVMTEFKLITSSSVLL